MSQSTLDTPASAQLRVATAGPVVEKLHALRSRIRVWLVVDGVCRLLVLAVLWIGLDLALDRWFQMDRPQRAVVLALTLLGMAWMVWRCLVRPLSRSLPDDALCLLVERHYRQLGEGLISAVQLSRQSNTEGGGASPELVAATIEHGVAAAAALRFQGVLRQRRFAANLLLTAALIVALAGVAAAVVRTNTMSIWFDRNLRLSNRPWPQDIYLTLSGAVDGVLRVPRAEPWPVGVSVQLARQDVQAPDDVLLEVRGAGDFHSERMERSADGRFFSGKLPAIDAAAEVRAVASGTSTPWVRVEPVDRPMVRSLAISLILPKYAGGARQSLAEGKGPYAVLPGSRVQVQGVANKALSAASLSQGPRRQEMQLGKINDFRHEFDYRADAAGVYSIALTDTEQLPSASAGGEGPLSSRVPFQFTLRTQIDRPPAVKLKLTGIGSVITARARLPLSASIDDDFAVSDAQLRWQTVPTAEGVAARSDVIQPADLAPQFGRPAIKLTHLLDVSTLKVPVATDLVLELTAADNNDVTGPGKGTSGKITLRVGSDDEVRAELLRREREQRQEIERLQKVHVGVVADTRELSRPGVDDKPWDAAAEQSATRVSREQKSVGAGLGMVARRIDDLLTEAANNRLEQQGGAMTTRLRSGVHARLTQIAEKDVPEVVARLDEARRHPTHPKERGVALAAAQAGQARIEAELNEVLKHMIKAEDDQLILSLIMEIQHGQNDVHGRALKMLQEQLKALFERGGTGRPQPAPNSPPTAPERN